MLKLPFLNNMIHFQATLKPIHNNLIIEKKKDIASFTYHTQEICFEMKIRKKWGNFGSKEEAFFNSTSNSLYKGIIHPKNQTKVKFKPKNEAFSIEPTWVPYEKMKMKDKKSMRCLPHQEKTNEH